MPTSNKRFYKNYDGTKLSLTVDRRGFLVGQSRLGYATLQSSPPGLVNVLGNFTGLAVGIGTTVIDGAWLQHDVTTLGMTTKAAAVFGEYDGEPITLKYDTATIFDGYVQTTTLAAQLDEDLMKEEVTVQVTCRGFEAVAYQLPPVNGALRVYGTPENPGSGYTTGRPAERVWERANAITGNNGTGYSGNFARNLIEERLEATAAQTGNQGSIIQELAIRCGTILDLSGTNPLFRTYQTVPHWRIDDTDVTSYSLATDQESAGAVILTKLEDETKFVAYQASGSNLIERTLSTGESVNWGLNTTAALVPLKATHDVYLAGFTAPFSAEVPLTYRAPYKVTFQHAGKTYRGTGTRITHSITPAKWLIGLDCDPVHLVTRRSDVFPSQPDHFRGTGGAGTVTLNWSTGTAGTATGTAVIGNYVILTDTAAANIDIGDQVQVWKSDGTLRDPRIFTVTSKPSAFGFTNVTFDQTMSTVSVAGDTLRFPDYGAPVSEWRVYWRDDSFPNRTQVYPYDTLSPNQYATTSPTATFTGLPADTYLFTVFAI